MDYDILESIANRKTTRTFAELTIPLETKTKINQFLSTQNVGPFGTKIKFQLVDITPASPIEVKKYGSFGLVIPSGYLIVGSVRCMDNNLEDYGYLLENIVLYLNHLGIGTYWISSHINRPYFKSVLKMDKNEIIPAVVMIGFPAKRFSLIEKIIRKFLHSDQRKPFAQLFFEEDFNKPINCQGKNKYLLALEMVRYAPSSKNRQPWRIVKDLKEKKFDFFLQHSKYESQFNFFSIQRLDVGIAMAHFAESMKQMNYPGTWSVQNPTLNLPNKKIDYIATWSY